MLINVHIAFIPKQTFAGDTFYFFFLNRPFIVNPQLVDSDLYDCDRSNSSYTNLVMARSLAPSPPDLLKQCVDGLNVLQEFSWLSYRSLSAGCM